ncbi:MAG: Hsp20/alpha crystallin family protein [Edaphocola sp.]
MVKTTQLAPRTLGGLFDELFNGNAPRFFRDDAAADDWRSNSWNVPVNIKENENGYTLQAVVPGVNKEDLKLQVNDKTLIIGFEHQNETEQKEEGKWLRKEYSLRSFKRSFTLGDQIDAEKISANFNNGILVLNLPKKEAALATNKTIEIQ